MCGLCAVSLVEVYRRAAGSVVVVAHSSRKPWWLWFRVHVPCLWVDVKATTLSDLRKDQTTLFQATRAFALLLSAKENRNTSTIHRGLHELARGHISLVKREYTYIYIYGTSASSVFQISYLWLVVSKWKRSQLVAGLSFGQSDA